MLKRTRTSQSTSSPNLFDQFLKKRNQNTGILQSQHESINAKVNSFEQLLRLTKNGSLMPRPQSSIPLHQKSPISSNNQTQPLHNLDQKDENSEETMIKFNKMATDINDWTSAKCEMKYQTSKVDNLAMRYQRKDDALRAKINKKNKPTHCNTMNVSRLVQKNGINQVQKRVAQQFYLGNYKNTQNRAKNGMLIRGNQLSKSSKSKIQLAEPILMYEKQHEFRNLKNKIGELEQKAKEKYGLKFEKTNLTQNKPTFQQNQHQQFVEPLKKFMRESETKYNERNYKKMVKQFIKEDSSIPAQLMGIIKSRSYKSFRPMSREGYGSRFIRI